MPVPTKKRRTDSASETVVFQVSRSGKALREIEIPADKIDRALSFLLGLNNQAESGAVPADEVFADLDAKYTRPGAVLRGARAKAELTQTELASKLGITQGDVSAMEHGRRPIGKEMAKRLATVLNVDYRAFL